ncbi:hypothetical protein C3Y94_025835 [Rhizobium ruizarguesonis]|uniref:DUF6197 family protein n=1 Tax=Rhizobium ruizarguesonis TaxID=2081791 RepID=UPI00163A9E6A|nr:hypothetical protein [Rhizobium ruizarguesonis]MBC2806575.1 hypothetical protein [Rhizobium ruizarguesonis]
MNRILHILTQAQELIRDPEHWAKEAYYATAGGKIATINTATCFCTAGAVRKVMGTGEDPLPALRILRSLLPNGTHDNTEGPILVWNDFPERTHDEVMELFDKAKELARANAA